MQDYKLKIYKFKVIDKESNRIMKFDYTTEIYKELGMNKTTVYDIIKNPNKERRKWRKYNIETIREPHILEY